jgi:hypothetical protein
MKSITQLLKIQLGENLSNQELLKALANMGDDYINIENAPYMRLVVEYIGTGPRNYPLVSVAHYGEQCGDPMRDPEMTFELIDAGGMIHWWPISYRNDYAGVCQEGDYAAMVRRDGRVLFQPLLTKQLAAFTRTWDRNIIEQGFVEAFKMQKGQTTIQA